MNLDASIVHCFVNNVSFFVNVPEYIRHLVPYILWYMSVLCCSYTMYLYLLTSFSLTDNSLVDGLLWRKTA